MGDQGPFWKVPGLVSNKSISLCEISCLEGLVSNKLISLCEILCLEALGRHDILSMILITICILIHIATLITALSTIHITNIIKICNKMEQQQVQQLVGTVDNEMC